MPILESVLKEFNSKNCLKWYNIQDRKFNQGTSVKQWHSYANTYDGLNGHVCTPSETLTQTSHEDQAVSKFSNIQH